MRTLVCALAFGVASLLLGCGSSFPVLLSISVTPSPATGTIGGPAVQFTATGSYSDFSTSTNVPGLAWSSSDTNTASISASGAAACIGGNGTPITITASAPAQPGGPGGPVTNVVGSAPLTCHP